MAMIDADAHVIETEHTWEFMDERDSKFRPVLISPYGDGRQFWLIDGKTRQRLNVNQTLAAGAREMREIETRLRHMDELGIDVQVLYPSCFLRAYTADPEAEVALCKSYNRWLAEIWRKGEGRLRWAAVPPLMSMEEAIAAARFGKENGACALFVRGLTEDRLPNDPYFYPFYEEASRLDLAICFHSATGSFQWEDRFKRASGFVNFKIPVLCAFHILAFDRVADRFPNLRFGFIEITSQWVPFAVRDVIKRSANKGMESSTDILRSNRMYVACETDDDLPFVLKYSGDDNLVIGTDYGHIDTSARADVFQALKLRREINPEVIDKILWDNPKALYHI